MMMLLVFIALFNCKPTEKNVSTATLENTYWRLSEVNGKPVTTPADSREVHIILSKDGTETRLKGFGGCNNMGGSYKVEENKISFTVISTKMMCEGRMETEDFLFSVLNKADNYKIKGETLELYQGDEKLTVFQSVYLK